MHVCFPHGAASDSRDVVSRSISAIRGFAKNMKAMSLKARAGDGGGGCHARATRRGIRPPDAGGLLRWQPRGCKDGSGGAATTASAKIAPAQLLQDEADGDDRRPADHQLHSEEEKQGGGGEKKQEYCDKCCSPLLDDDHDDGAAAVAKEWVAEPEPGVVMTLAPRPDGTNHLRRVRFREELFDAWAAQSWWADNSDRIVELYSVVQSSSSDDDEDEDAAAAAMSVTPCHSEEEEDGTNTGAEPASPSMSTSNFSGEPSSGSHKGSGATAGSPVLGLVTAALDNTRSGSKKQPTAATSQHHDDEYDVYDGGDQQPRMMPWREWAEEYEPGVFITVRAYPGHPQPLQLRHVELSRERFGEVKARVWWQENKDRLRSLYSF